MIADLSGVATVMAAALAAVFLVAAVAKLRAPAATATELGALGVPQPGIAARVVPAAELLLAGALLARPRLGAALALLVLAGFTAVLVRAVRSGIVVSCGCLGSISRDPVSWTTVGRNAALLMMAAVGLAATAPVLPDLASIVAASLVLLVAALAVQLLAAQQRIGHLVSVRLAGERGGTNHTATDPVSGGTS